MPKKRKAGIAQKAKRRRKRDHAQMRGAPFKGQSKGQGSTRPEPFEAGAAALSLALGVLLMKKKPKGPKK